MSSSSSISEIKKFFEASNCTNCSKKSKHLGKIEYVCTHVLCKDNLTLVCKNCHEAYHQSQLYSTNKKYIQPIQDFLEDLYYHVKTQNDKFDLINVISKSASTLLPENFPNYEDLFALLKEIESDMDKNQINFYNEIFECINNIYMTESHSVQIQNLKKIKQNVTYNCCSQFEIINCTPFEDLEKCFTNKLKDAIYRKTINAHSLQTFITQREKKVAQFKSQQNTKMNEILNKVSEVHEECLKDRKENCKGNNRGSLSDLNDPCMSGGSTPSCDECIDAFEYYNKKLENVF